MSESAVSAKRGWGSFGVRPAQSETPARAAAKRRPPGGGAVKRRCEAHQWVQLDRNRNRGTLHCNDLS